MGKAKRFLSFFVAFLMVLTIIPTNAIVLAIESEETTGNNQTMSEIPIVNEVADTDTGWYWDGNTLCVYQGKITKGELYNALVARYGSGTYKYGTSKPTLSWALGGTSVSSGQTNSITLSGGTLYVGKKVSTFSWTDYSFPVQAYGYSVNFPTLEKATVHMDGNVQAGEQHVTLKAAILAGAVKDWGDYAGITPTVYAYDDGTLSTGWHKLEWFIDSALTSGIYPATASRPIKFEWAATGDLPAYTVEVGIVFSDHERTSNPVVTAPTCTEKGYTTYTCSCGLFTVKGNETAALGHTPGVDATCTEAQTCTTCGAAVNAALGHTPGAEATCTTAQTCVVCNIELAPALGHTWTDATYEAPKTCTTCGATEGEPLVPPVAFVNGVGYATFADAIADAEEGAVIVIVSNISNETIVVTKNITITGRGAQRSTNGDSVVLNNVTIDANGAAELTVSNLTFTGNSWINVGSATKLVVSGVTADVTPSNTAQTNSRSAFISLGRSEQHFLELTIENCNIVSRGGSDPVLGWAAITNATITGSTFGAADAYQTNSDSIKFMSIADGATFTITDNTIYSNYNGIVFGQNTTRANKYSVTAANNTFVGGADHIWVEVSGSNTCNGTFNISSNNTVNGNAFAASDIKVHPNITTWTSYAGVDVTVDENGKVTGGTLAFYAEDVIAEGYVVDANGVVTFNPTSGKVAYRAYINNSVNRKAIQVDLANLNAKESVVVKLYDANGNLLTTTTLNAGGAVADEFTVNIVLAGNPSGSWTTEIHADLTIANAPETIELWVDGELMDTFENALGRGTNVDEYNKYLALDCVYKAAKVGDTYYATVTEAIKAAQDGETVTLLADIADSETIKIVGKSIILDLNGKTISGTCNASQSTLILIENGAKLTVKDSAEGGKITFAAGTSNVGWTVDVKGEFVLESGTIELTGSWNIGYAVEIRPNSWGSEYTKASVFTMNGGNIVSSDSAVRVASSSADGHKNVSASFIMNDGTIDAEWDGVFIQQSNTVYDDLSFTINGGTINSALNPVRVYGPAPTGYVNDQNCMSIVLAGGTMTYTGTETYTWVIDGILRVGGGSSVETILENGTLAVSAEIAQSVAAPEGYQWVTNGDAYTLAECEYVAEANGVKYTTLEAAIKAGGEVKLLADIELNGAITVTGTVVLDLAGYTISYTSTTQGEAMITNKGNLTINDSVGTGVINYNYVGAADNSYSKGNYTITNAGTLTVNGGKITIANLSGHAKYPIDNNSTTGNAVLVINGGHLYNYNTSAIRMFCNSTTYRNSITINGGLVEGYCAIWVQNPGSATVNAELTVNGGEIKSTAKAYVNGTAALEEVGSAIYYTVSGADGAWSADSFVNLAGGTFNENVYLAEDAPEAITVGEAAIFNGYIELPEPEIDINITIAGRTISADTYLQLNLYFANATFAGIKDIYAVVQVGEHEAYVIEYGADGWSIGQNGYAYDALHIKGIAAKEMGDAINIQFFIGNANDDVADVAASDVIVYSIKDYAYAVLGGASFTTEAKRAMYDLLKYGATAQQYFGYNTENLVDAGLTAYSQYARTENTTPNKQNNIEIGANYRLGNTMSLDDSLVLNYYFNTWHTEQYNGKLTAKATYIGWDNAEHVIDIAASEFAYDVDRGMTMIALKGLSGGDVSSDITLEVYDENGTVLYRSIYSIEAYLTAAMAAYPSDAYLYQSIANYGQAMAAYLKQLNNIQ